MTQRDLNELDKLDAKLAMMQRQAESVERYTAKLRALSVWLDQPPRLALRTFFCTYGCIASLDLAALSATYAGAAWNVAVAGVAAWCLWGCVRTWWAGL